MKIYYRAAALLAGAAVSFSAMEFYQANADETTYTDAKVYADNITVDLATIGENRKVSINIRLEDNPGLKYFRFKINRDPRLESGLYNAFGGPKFDGVSAGDDGRYHGGSTEELEGNLDLFRLIFYIPKDAVAGDVYYINFDREDPLSIINRDNLYYDNFHDGSITIINSASSSEESQTPVNNTAPAQEQQPSQEQQPPQQQNQAPVQQEQNNNPVSGNNEVTAGSGLSSTTVSTVTTVPVTSVASSKHSVTGGSTVSSVPVTKPSMTSLSEQVTTVKNTSSKSKKYGNFIIPVLISCSVLIAGAVIIIKKKIKK